jgi:hypothetical protein
MYYFFSFFEDTAVGKKNPARHEWLRRSTARETAMPGIDFTKLHFGQKLNFHPRILDDFPPKATCINYVWVL